MEDYNSVEMKEMYMENLEGYILDEDKIVTYKWLSRTLEIPVNLAKGLLHEFVESHRGCKEKCDLYVTFMIGGTLKSGGSTIALVKEDDKTKFYEKLDKVTCEHEYSVHKSRLRDLHMVYGPDYEKWKEAALGTTKFSAISYRKASPRSCDDIDASRKSAQLSTEKVPAMKTVKKSTSKSDEQVNGLDKQKSTESTGKQNGSETRSIKNGIIPQEKLTKINKGGIAQMFANQNTKQQTSDPKKGVEQKTKKVEKPQGIASFFNKNASPTEIKKTEKSSKVEEEKKVPQKTEKEKKSPEKQAKAKDSEDVANRKPLGGKENKAVKLDESKKTKAKTKSLRHKKDESDDDEDPLPKRKRRRIIEISDSDSSDDEGMDIDDDDDDGEEPCPLPVNPEPTDDGNSGVEETIATPDSPKDDKLEGSSGRKRRRRLVDKTFMDEEGYIVTKKEYVFESCSESEQSDSDKPKLTSKIVEEKKQVEEKDQDVEDKKKISPQKNKQTTLMSFFKKR